MTHSCFIQSIAANIAYWDAHEGLTDPHVWPELDRERANLFRAVEFGLRQADTWSAAADLALKCHTYIFERSYWSEWILVLEQAMLSCPGEDLAVKGHLANELGTFYRKLRRLDEALVAHEQAEALGRTLGDPILLASAHLGLGRVHLRLRHYEEAVCYARLALSGFEASGPMLDKAAYGHNLLGIIALGRGDYELSAQEFYKARLLFRQTNQVIEMARTSVNLCETLSHLGRAAEALALFDEAAAIFAEHDLHLERTHLYITRGFFHYKRDELAQAEAAFRQAYPPIMRRAGPIYQRSLIEMNLGNVLLLQGNTEESRVYFSSAVTGFRLVNAQTMLANSLDGLAETSLTAGDYDEAIALYEEALAIVIAIPEDAFARRMEKKFKSLLEELESPGEVV